MSAFNDVIAEAMGSIASVAGNPVTYHRGNAWVALTATAGRTDFNVDDGSGFFTKVRSRDYLLKACDLQLSGSSATPQKGDLIKEQIGTTIYTYEVLRPDGGEQLWRYSDHGRSVLRVHTKLKGSVPA